MILYSVCTFPTSQISYFCCINLVMKIRIAFSVTNCICHDQRVLKIAEAIAQPGIDITIIGKRSGKCCETGSVPFRTKRFRMIFKKGFLFYKFFNIRLLFHLLFNKYDLFVANDLDTLLPNFIASELKGGLLVYDSHEYFKGVPEIQNRPFVKWVWTAVEKIVFPHLKNVMTVSDSIAEQYEKEYGLKPVTVRNCSGSAENIDDVLRDEMGFDKESLLLIFQGGGINIDRGGEELIEAIKLTEKVNLLIVGSGDVLPLLKEKVRKLNLTEQVHFFPKMPWKEMMRFTKTCDIGLTLDKDTNLNYRFSLPNKLFDYINAGIPVIASDLPEVAKIIEQNRCGIVIPSVTPENISKAIKTLRDNRKLLEELKRNTVLASGWLNWENEALKVEDFYRPVIAKIAGSGKG